MPMPIPYQEIYRTCSRPLEPISTGTEPVLARLTGIEAIRLDFGLWREGFSIEAPHHRTVTTDY